jgi:urea transporter
MLVGLGMGAHSGVVSQGIYGFNPVLTAIALGCIFNTPSVRAFLLAVLGSIATVFVQATLSVILAGHYGGDGVPVYTLPFVLVTWMFLLAKPEVAQASQTEEVAHPSAVG